MGHENKITNDKNKRKKERIIRIVEKGVLRNKNATNTQHPCKTNFDIQYWSLSTYEIGISKDRKQNEWDFDDLH